MLQVIAHTTHLFNDQNLNGSCPIVSNIPRKNTNKLRT